MKHKNENHQPQQEPVQQQNPVQHYNAQQLLPDEPAEFNTAEADEFFTPETFLDLYSRPEDSTQAVPEEEEPLV